MAEIADNESRELTVRAAALTGHHRLLDGVDEIVDTRSYAFSIGILFMPNIVLRPATELDWDFVAAVTEACMREYAEQTWGAWLPDSQSDYQPAIHQIIQFDDEDVGCTALIEEQSVLTLTKLYILPSYQNRGIGTALLQRLIERARASAKPVRLRVLRVNPARRFYEKNGFVVTHSTDLRHFMSNSKSGS